MRSLQTVVFCVVVVFSAQAQSVNKEVKLSDLAIPTSPAFVITDVAPSTIQTPVTPKAFVLGLVQSYEKSSDGFPDNYSAEFTPYWWFRPAGRDVYSLLGLKTTRDASNRITEIGKEDPFSGLKFLNVSLAFINKDLIADTLENSHKVVSIGMRTTIVRFHQKNYATDIRKKVQEWHDLAQVELAAVQDEMSRASEARSVELQNEFTNFKPKTTSAKLEEINALIAQKPLFAWDLAGAYATYGVNDTTWNAGRVGVWTTMSTYLPIDLGGVRPHKNYFNLNVVARYLRDNYYSAEPGILTGVNNFDIGWKIALEFDNLSVGYESLYRYIDGNDTGQKRSVGIINYRIIDNIFLNGAFGENFGHPNKLIALFGINWGIGTETVKLPE